MVKWSEEVRRNDANVFLRSAIADSQAHKFPVWVLVDARRTCDLQFFDSYRSKCQVLTVRIEASAETRASRGWCWTAGIDDSESECGLDAVTEWDLVVKNEADVSEEQLLQKLQSLISAGCCAARGEESVCVTDAGEEKQ